MRQIRSALPAMGLIALGTLAAGCPDITGEQTETAKAAVEQAFQQANPQGRTGVEVLGKTVWLEAPMFDKSCLEKNDLAFNDDARIRPAGSPPRITPTYKNQRWFTASTEQGFCIYLGDSPQLTVDDVSWGGDAFRVSTTVTMAKASPWFECLDAGHKKRQFRVTVDDAGKADIEGQLDTFQGACPSPLPEGEARGPGKAPPKVPHAAPSKAEVIKLARTLDDALFEADFGKVQAMTACYNLEDTKPHYGNCSVAEFVMIGPAFHGEQRAQDGTPWTEYTIRDLDEVQRIVADKNLKGVYHATMVHRRTKRDRSFAVQWADDQWKMVGVIGKKAESLTSVRYVYDLHRKDKNEVFRKRLDGEEIDEAGNLLNPEDEEQE
jgi:hypothetical protein